MKTSDKISQIVRLKQAVQRWRNRRFSAGSLAVYVGSEHRRFVIPTRFLKLHVFVSLLNKAEEEFGFQTTGGLLLPCDVVTFKKLLKVLDENEPGVGDLEFDEFMKKFSDLVINSCKVSDSRDSFTSLLLAES
ncbi:protein SMALL AUXIN UP-REGULATED RNA 12-like [Bidens hawaiensis]|uniref:protein SMALL AUXIN UP-REGULATED RNA 12-like n=1 Tax=Bidens hawaiensis TaxID=980011 RepID=UPI00404B70ED